MITIIAFQGKSKESSMINDAIVIGGGSTMVMTPPTYFSNQGECIMGYVGECSSTKNILCDEMTYTMKIVEWSRKSLSSPIDLIVNTPPKSTILT